MKNTTRVSVIAGLVLALACGAALAQTRKPPAAKPAPVDTSSGGIGRGDIELGFFGNLNDSDAGTLLLVGASAGRYMTDQLALRVTAAVAFADTAGISTFIFSPYVSGEYQFPIRGTPLVPYAGAGLGLFLLSNDTFFVYSVFATPVAGVKYFLNERTSVEYALSYQVPVVGGACDDIDCYDVDVTTLQNTVRLNIYY
ncbi:MAG: hypothetical protein ACRETF_04525 [Nevskiaceae bacterium]